MVEIKENKNVKILKSKDYNYYFDKNNGLFVRYGTTQDDDPDHSPVGPEILDIEISTSDENYDINDPHVSLDGGCIGGCKFCYKSNIRNLPTYNMSLEEFKDIIDKMGPQLTQIAIGIMNIDSNPHLFDMAEYARSKGVVPNMTIHGLDNMTVEMATKIKKVFGAVAVSCYNIEKTFDTIKMLTDVGMDQVNIHFMLSKQTLFNAYNLLKLTKEDSRVEKLNAVVFLSLKQKGFGHSMQPVPFKEFKVFANHILDEGYRFGFDSCTANKFLRAIKQNNKYESIKDNIEPCESGLFSSYVNAQGEFYACSFVEGVDYWKDGVSVLQSNNFLEIWNSDKVVKWRETLHKCNRSCPVFSV